MMLGFAIKCQQTAVRVGTEKSKKTKHLLYILGRQRDGHGSTLPCVVVVHNSTRSCELTIIYFPNLMNPPVVVV